MARPRPVFQNARREVLHMLAPIRAEVRLLVQRWNVRGTVADGGAGRPRRDDEYPEKSAAHWEDLGVRARRAAALLHGIAALADEELAKVRRRPGEASAVSREQDATSTN